MSLTLSDPPTRSPITEVVKSIVGTSDFVTKVWENYFRSRDERLQAASHVMTSVPLEAQAAAIGATALVSAADQELYEVGWYLRETTVDAVSASLQVTIRWTDGGVAMSKSGANLTTNLTTTHESMPFAPIRVDGGTNITYEVAFAAGGGQLQYSLDMVAKAVGS